MKKKIINIVVFILLLVITVLYTYYFRFLTDDELYNYGFSYSIINGLVPYKDFSMIIPPLFSYILALFLKTFGSHLIIYHIVIAFIIGITTFISYKLIGLKTIILYILMLMYPYIGYNTFSLCLLFILFYIEEKKVKYLPILEPIIISLMFLTKQTLGLLVIPSLIFSKNKKKTLAIYLIFISVFLLYLILNGTFLKFFDYCLFGLFDFASKNSSSFSFLLIFEILIIISLMVLSIITKRKDIFFCLMFQVITLPIVNTVHFTISFIPVAYLILKKYKHINYLTFLGVVATLTFFITYNYIYIYMNGDYLVMDNYPVNNFMKDRVASTYIDSALNNVKNQLVDYEDYTLYTFGNMAYLLKLSYDIPITKYDLINNGNMGYNGANRYIEEIDNYCNKNKCLFIINDNEISDNITSQANKDILIYVQNNYYKIYSSNILNIYINYN